ncbi:acyl carrier protein [Saccharopolyspora sp. NPDC047091]|uniref:acyl carrier protein n=1 Tax=Saccharopolyspora sp. NPDC047091 TaxID=3155924 RepID=UPI0033F55CE0
MNAAENDVRIKQIMIESLRIDRSPHELTNDLVLDSDAIRMDSLNLLELIVRIERELGGEVSDRAVFEANLRTVGDLIDLVRIEILAPAATC